MAAGTGWCRPGTAPGWRGSAAPPNCGCARTTGTFLSSDPPPWRLWTGSWTTRGDLQVPVYLAGRPARGLRSGRRTALLRRAADPGGEQITEADDTVYLATLHDGQMAEAVQQHDLGRVLDRCLRARRLRVLGHPRRYRDRGEVRP